MNNELSKPGVFSIENLYRLVRTYCLSFAPHPLIEFNVSQVVNTFMRYESGLNFNMSNSLPPHYSGQDATIFEKYKESENLPPENSSAWFTVQFLRIETTDDVERLKYNLETMRNWMHSTGYLIKDECGYLPTQKLFDEYILKIKRYYKDT